MSYAAHREAPNHADIIARALATVGGHLAIGRGGATLYYDTGWASGRMPEQIQAACVAVGLPMIDSRMLPIEVVCRLAAGGPMVAVGREPDQPPWHALSFAPLAHVAAAYRQAGAEVLNLDVPDAPSAT